MRNKSCAEQYGSEIIFEEQNYIAICMSHETALFLVGLSVQQCYLALTYTALQKYPEYHPYLSVRLKCFFLTSEQSGRVFLYIAVATQIESIS